MSPNALVSSEDFTTAVKRNIDTSPSPVSQKAIKLNDEPQSSNQTDSAQDHQQKQPAVTVPIQDEPNGSWNPRPKVNFEDFREWREQIDREFAEREEFRIDGYIDNMINDFIEKALQDHKTTSDTLQPTASAPDHNNVNVGATDLITREFLEENGLNPEYYDMLRNFSLIRRMVQDIEGRHAAAHNTKYKFAKAMLSDRWKQRPEPKYWQAIFQFTYEGTYEEVAAAKPKGFFGYHPPEHQVPATMKVLLLGATGNIGSRLIPALLAHNHSVVVYVRSESKLKNLVDSAALSKCTIVTGDATNTRAIEEAILTHQCNALVNGAGLAAVFPWQAPQMQGIVQAVATAAVEASKKLGYPIRCWFLGGLTALDFPGRERTKISY
ncbi:MAG: hypothetical protein Q9168_006417 [Polycauliona sp. 1 TL-2023]